VIDIDVTVSREELEKLAEPFIDRTIELINSLLKEVGYDMTMIDHILLVGGTSCIPMVKQILSSKFGAQKIKVAEKPMLAIAEGAAILAHRLGDEYEAAVEDSSAIGDISYSTNHNYYIELADGDGFTLDRVIEKQTPLPIQVSKNFKTTTNNQKIIKVSIHCDVEDGKKELQALGFYLVNDNLSIGSELIFDFNMDINEIMTVTVAPKGKKNLAGRIILGRGNPDHKALKAIDELIGRSTTEYKTVDGEVAFLKYITQQIKEIERLGFTEIEENKWHEIYYKTTEKYDEIRNTEHRSSDVENSLWRAKSLVIEFGDLLDPFDKTTMFNLINQIEISGDETEKMQLAEKLNAKTDEYGLLNAALRIESLADRILNIPGTRIGETTRQAEINRLNQISVDVKTKLKMHQIEPVKDLMVEAYDIIGKYRQYL
jgi:molecular chaperone DnaK